MPVAPVSLGAPRILLEVRPQVASKCCLRASFICGHIVSVLFSLVLYFLPLESRTLILSSWLWLTLATYFCIKGSFMSESGLREMLHPTETSLHFAFLASQLVTLLNVWDTE